MHIVILNLDTTAGMLADVAYHVIVCGNSFSMKYSYEAMKRGWKPDKKAAIWLLFSTLQESLMSYHPCSITSEVRYNLGLAYS